MIHSRDEYNTEHICFNQGAYCLYCGKPLERNTTWDHYERTDYYHCDCKDAQKEFEIHSKIFICEEEIRRLKRSLPKVKYGIKQSFGQL